MIRKLLMVAAVAVIPIGAVVATGSIAGAGVNEPGTATCGATTGTLSFSTPISNAGHSLAPGGTFTQTTTVTATLTKCVPSAKGLTLTKGAVKGTVKEVTKNTTKKSEKVATCAGLSGSSAVTASLTTTWTASTPIDPTVSKFSSEKGGTVTIGSNTYGTFILPATTAGNVAGSGSFLGTNVGKGDKSNARTVKTVTQLLTACKTPQKTLAITTWTSPGSTFG
jgi:hypothetical protein